MGMTGFALGPVTGGALYAASSDPDSALPAWLAKGGLSGCWLALSSAAAYMGLGPQRSHGLMVVMAAAAQGLSRPFFAIVLSTVCHKNTLNAST